MKILWQYALITSALTLSSCGGKKSDASSSQISAQYALQSFKDVNNKSSLDLDKLKDLPSIVDLKENMTAVRDQAERGTCSFFAATALVESAIKKKMNAEVNLSEEYLNYAVKSKGKGYSAQDEGGWPVQNIHVAINQKTGFLLERDWPYQPSWFGQKSPCMDFSATDAKAPAECFSHKAPPESVLAKIIPADNFESLYLDADTTNEFISVIAQYKVPLAISVPVNLRGWPDSGDVNYDEDMRDECIEGKVDCGGHTIVITGYDLDKKVFFFKNSWGKKWGHDGYGTIPFDVIDRHVHQASPVVQLKEKINLPENYDKDPFEFIDFSVNSKELADHSEQINTYGKINNVGFHFISTTSTLVKKSTATDEEPNDKNAPTAKLSADDQSKFNLLYVSQSNFFYPEKEVQNIEWNAEAPNTVIIPASMMLIPTIADLKFFKDNELLVRTSLYVYSDESGYKLLKRIYHPLNN